MKVFVNMTDDARKAYEEQRYGYCPLNQVLSAAQHLIEVGRLRGEIVNGTIYVAIGPRELNGLIKLARSRSAKRSAKRRKNNGRGGGEPSKVSSVPAEAAAAQLESAWKK